MKKVIVTAKNMELTENFMKVATDFFSGKKSCMAVSFNEINPPGKQEILFRVVDTEAGFFTRFKNLFSKTKTEFVIK